MLKLLEPEKIAENIMERCKMRKISVKTLCTEVKIGINTVYDIRSRGSYPRVDTLYKLACGLGCTMEELCTMDDESSEDAE